MGKRILFVEEDANFRDVFMHALREALATERLDVAFVEAGSAAEARSRLREGGLDAALIDITLPDANGLDLVGDINNGGPGSPIPTLVSAATLESSVAVRALEAGARGSTLQASFGARECGCDKEADQRRTLLVGMSTPPVDEWGSVSSVPALPPARVKIFQRPRKGAALLTPCLRREGVLLCLVCCL